MKVFGRVDGVDVIFQQKEGGRWEVPVPLDKDGEYVVEIMAEDDAGNIAYIAKMLFTVNRNQLSAYMVPYPYLAQLQDSYNAYLTTDTYTAKLLG